MFGYKCSNVIFEDGIYEVFEPAKIICRNIPKIDADQSEGFSGFEDSSGEEEKDEKSFQPKHARKSLEKHLNSKSRNKHKIMMKKAPSESTEKVKNELENDNSLIKHAQTEEHGINDIMIIKSQPNAREISPKSHVSNYSNTASPVAKLGKYRWAKKMRKQSLDSKISSKTDLKDEINSFNESESKDSVEKNENSKHDDKNIDEFEVDDNRRLRRINTIISENYIPPKVMKNLKYVKFLRRTSVLKKTLLGRIMKVTQK